MKSGHGMHTRRILLTQCVAAATLGLVHPARAQAWPRKPVVIIVPFAAGGNTDGIARIVAPRLGEAFAQQFVVENRVGAGGALAAEAVARSAADGHTLLMAALPQIAIVPAAMKVRYDPRKDFEPIGIIGTNPFVLAVNRDVPVKTPAEFVRYVRAHPRELSYASAGPGSLMHLSMALFLKIAGLEMIHVSYKGNAPALSDVVAGHVAAAFTNLSDALPQAASGTIRLLAVSGSGRARQLPDVPTISESGFPTFKTVTWNGLMAPAGTPRDTINRIAAEIARAVNDQKFVERLANYGVDPLGNGPEQFRATVAEDIAFWSEAVSIAGIKER
jgi:tripartite-type tricarboxylate transporter receptor subunit TctC